MEFIPIGETQPSVDFSRAGCRSTCCKLVNARAVAAEVGGPRPLSRCRIDLLLLVEVLNNEILNAYYLINSRQYYIYDVNYNNKKCNCKRLT